MYLLNSSINMLVFISKDRKQHSKVYTVIGHKYSSKIILAAT